jgi:hypothetical protein
MLRVTLGEPLWRELGQREVVLALGDEHLPLGELPARLGLDDWSDAGLVAVVNDHLVPVAGVTACRLKDCDHVVLQLMLAGG